MPQKKKKKVFLNNYNAKVHWHKVYKENFIRNIYADQQQIKTSKYMYPF